MKTLLIGLILIFGASICHAASKEEPVIAAIYSKDLKKLSAIISSGVSVDTRSRQSGKTLLMIAAEVQNNEAVKFLIDKKADLEAPSKYLSKTVLFLAAYAGNQKAVELLLKSGANPNALDGDSNNPLREAMLANKPKIVRMLIDAGSSLDQKNKDGKSMRDIGLEFGSDQVKEEIQKAPNQRLQTTTRSFQFSNDCMQCYQQVICAGRV